MSRVSVCRLTWGQRLLCCVLLSAFHRKGKDDNRFASSSSVSDLMMTNGKAVFQILLMSWIIGAPGMSRLSYLDIILGNSNTAFKVSIHVTWHWWGNCPVKLETGGSPPRVSGRATDRGKGKLSAGVQSAPAFLLQDWETARPFALPLLQLCDLEHAPPSLWIPLTVFITPGSYV